ncbi:MAG: cytochrome c3 family protein [Fimbriimonadaceae bacterium]|nr:cytochrome c3 family protein [Fimbriimonadaceae bacterium]
MAQLFAPAANTIATASLFALAGLPFVLVAGSAITRGSFNTKVGVPLNQPAPFSHKHHVKELGIDCRFCHVSVETSANAGAPPTEVCMTCHSQIWTNSPLLQPIRQSWETNTPVKWNLVNRAPDFVYFNHAVHIAKGVNCNTCHGKIQEMEITWKGQAFHMGWCLDCHEDPSKYMVEISPEKSLTPRQQVFEVYRKISAGVPLSAVEMKLMEGLPQRAPNDKVHEGVKLMADRGINKSALTDCYICHR